MWLRASDPALVPRTCVPPPQLYAGHSLADAHPSNETRDATTCNTVGAMGRQVRRRLSPRPHATAIASPARCPYHGLHCQVDSRKTSAPAASFGSSPRFSNKAFISRAHAAVDQVGVDSPGAVYARASQFRGARVKGGRKNRRWRQQKNVAIPVRSACGDCVLCCAARTHADIRYVAGRWAERQGSASVLVWKWQADAGLSQAPAQGCGR